MTSPNRKRVKVVLSTLETHIFTAFQWRSGWHCAPPVPPTLPVYATPRDAALAHAQFFGPNLSGAAIEATEIEDGGEGI